ncbi:MAG: hypothetical protein KGJ98_11490 [Chloroflexota bacterium]|nr:hypothetical protein [Chloroflexota bacterium]
MVLLAGVALTTLIANSAARLRAMAVAFLAVSIAANAIAAGATTIAQLAVLAAAGLAASGILFVAARDGDYGEDPEWRLWVATLIAAVATPAAFVSFRSADLSATSLAAFMPVPSEVLVEVAAFWLLSSGTAILVTARSAVRTSLGALLLLTGVQLLVRLAPGPQLELTIGIAWVEVVVALVGAFLIVNERAVRE